MDCHKLDYCFGSAFRAILCFILNGKHSCPIEMLAYAQWNVLFPGHLMRKTGKKLVLF